MTSTTFLPNVEIFDDEGVFRGRYLAQGEGAGRHYIDEVVWEEGGRVLFQWEVEDWEWEVRPFTSNRAQP